MILLFRHGLDDETYIGGWSTVDLIEEGIAQTRDAAIFLSNSEYKIDKIYSSDVKRAKTTTQILKNYIDVPVEYSPKFRELNKGLLNGINEEEGYKLYPQYKGLKDIHLAYPEGESMIEFYKRIKGELEYILTLDNSVIVTHRGVINMLYFILNDLYPNMNKKQFGVTHASIHALNPIDRTINKLR